MTQELFLENHGPLIQNTLVKQQQVKAEEVLLSEIREMIDCYHTGEILATSATLGKNIGRILEIPTD